MVKSHLSGERKRDSGAGASWSHEDGLQALIAADQCLWRWTPSLDRLALLGAVPGCLDGVVTRGQWRKTVVPDAQARLEDFLAPRPPGTSIDVQLRMKAGPLLHWQGRWLAIGGRAAGQVTVIDPAHYAINDTLTQLLGRQAFLSQARVKLAEPGRWQLIVADLDRLRRLNDALGHDRADMVLVELAKRLASVIPPRALCARVGEDEFAVLCPDQPQGLSTRVREALEQPLRMAGFDLHPSFSVGVVLTDGGPDALEMTELLRRAEVAIEAVKTSGRGGAVAYGRAMETDGLSRLAMEADLRGAMERNEIGPHFQPVVRLANGALAGFEALARWRHPRRGLVGPDEFLPVLEDMGLMNRLGQQMIRASCLQLATWKRAHAGARDLWVSVNLSTIELERTDLVEDVGAIIKASGLSPGALKLEVTESHIMRNPDAAAVVLRSLRAAGAGLALDDFGTGFSSLSYLARLPFDTLKIDRFFVRTMGNDAGSEKIIRSVVKLGQDLDLEVVAEGVETPDDAAALLTLGCDYGQGFGYARPLGPVAAEGYLINAEIDGVAPLNRAETTRS